MKSILTHSRAIVYFGFAYLCLTSSSLLAQRLPHMFIPMDESRARRDWFDNADGTIPSKKSILKTLARNIEQQTTYEFDFTSFVKFIDIVKKSGTGPDAINIYFGAINASSPAPFPAGLHEKEIVMLFAPAKITQDGGNSLPYAKDVGSIYFALTPGSLGVTRLNKAQKEAVCKYYEDNILKAAGGLNEQIEAAPENGGTSKSDTKSIFFDTSFLQELFVNEQQHQTAKYTPITGIQFNLVAITNNGKDASPDFGTHAYKNRLIPQMELMHAEGGVNKVFYLDQQPDYETRRGQTPVQTFKKIHSFKLFSLFGFDNGQLCPPNCPR